MSIRTLLVLLAVTLFVEETARAQPNAEKDATTIAYPVGDWVVPISTNRNGEQIIATSENELMARIRKQVAPATWEQAGGNGSMRYERQGFKLLVRQSPKVHAELKDFLAKLRREQVSIEVRIVTVSAKALEELRGGWAIHWTKKEGVESALLDEAKLYRFLETVQGDRAAHIMQLPKITLFDGQVATAGWGIQARLLPAISADRRYVTVQTEISRVNQRDADILPPGINKLKLAVAAKVPDQRTVAILAGTALAEIRVETPSLLSSVPYVSRLVHNVGISREPVMTIVLLTPRIVREEDAGDVSEVRPLRNGIQAEENGRFPLIRTNGSPRTPE
jgi:type II secretory pathway component GspD/PulD (secretin)